MFLTRTWQRIWWQVFGRGQLLLVLAEREGEPVALAPLFCDAGMVFFAGSGGSDYLDFVGDTSVLAELLETARSAASDFVGFRFYHVPDDSMTGVRLQRAALDLGLACFDEGSLAAPRMEMKNPAVAVAAAGKKSLVRHERALTRQSLLQITHSQDAADICEHLNVFFEQHINRWAATSSPSLFLDPAWREFYARLSEAAGDAAWLRFTRIAWKDRPIAYHFGFHYRGEYLWYKPSFDIELAKWSPGEVLLRQLLLAAVNEEARVFDFGLGEEAFKQRFATHTRQVRTWGLYPPEVDE